MSSALPAAQLLLLLTAAAPASPESRYELHVDAALAATREVYPVPKALVFAVMRQESAFDPKAVSKVGARGLMQLMPYNAEKVGMDPKDLFDPPKNILAGVRLLAALLRYYKGDVISALVAYNSHPRDLFSPVPQNGETPEYCIRVLAFYQQYQKAYPAQPVSPAAGSAGDAGVASPSPSSADSPTPPPRAIHFVPGQ